MKRSLLYLSLFLATVLPACKKQHKNIVAPVTKKYSIKFNVTGFIQQVVGSVDGNRHLNSLETYSAPLDSPLTVLHYLVFDSHRNIVSQTKQLSTDASFGTISDALAAGTYTIVFGAGDSNLSVSSQNAVDNQPLSQLIPIF